MFVDVPDYVTTVLAQVRDLVTYVTKYVYSDLRKNSNVSRGTSLPKI